ncbi:hypothetical protein CathTA2_2430 [Caldalkalibacillus thermarum TA2.A1]|uniref:Uncharacterized protein n=1 Tax=Caldalkalibacillus thermarum (strain TA2.A1) TaxID=986075 RepID=F5L9C5_CALTT|nr:hypothetical protein [Caldalkalibacillus thermarum]EGL82067.1 hypothetical protein CathTA2_2430 [Caldalkalibacillus thermarum TA2.A1]QZT34016.1 hypothetical protein HUR95_00825 [Caldalkalibacillus thermarum TA2.A1]
MSLYDDVVEIARDIERVKDQLDASLEANDDIEELQDTVASAVTALEQIYNRLY